MSFTHHGGLSLILACGVAAGGCGGCSKTDSTPNGAPSASASTPSVVAEVLPRCRTVGQPLVIPGEEVVVGDVAVGPSGLLVGVIRTVEGRRLGAVLKAQLDLTAEQVFDVGPAFGDDPPPSPRFSGAVGWVAFLGRDSTDAGAPGGREERDARTRGTTRTRTLRLSKIEASGLGRIEATIPQQADESTAFDVAFSDGTSPVGIVAWDEDAPLTSAATRTEAGAPDTTQRGFVKIQGLDGNIPRRVASPETSDAEAPRLLARPGGGFWLAWLARRVEEEAYAVEGPGERRAFRWVEVMALNDKGESVGPARRVTSEKGRVMSFELARTGDPPSGELTVMVQDEITPNEGGGGRIVRHRVRTKSDGVTLESADLIDSGVGSALAELVPFAPTTPDASSVTRWLAWTDTSERAHMTPLGVGLVALGSSSAEPALDGVRVLAAAPPNDVFVLAGTGEDKSGARPRPELRRFTCK